MNIKKITAFAAAVVIAAGICTGVPTGTGTGSPLAVTAEAATKQSGSLEATVTHSGVSIDMKWKSVSNAAYYNVMVMYSTDAIPFASMTNVKFFALKKVTPTADTGSELSLSIFTAGLPLDIDGKPVHYSVQITSMTKDDNLVSDTLNYSIWFESLDDLEKTKYESESTKTTDKKTDPFNLTPTLYDDGTVDVTWNEIDGAYSYQLYAYYGVSSPLETVFVSPVAKKDFDITGTKHDGHVKAIPSAKYTLDISSLPKGKTAKIMIVAYDKNNNGMDTYTTIELKDLKVNKRSGTSGSSSTKAAAPKNFKAQKTNNSVTLTWDAVDGADMYRVYKYNPETKKYEKYKDVKNAKCTIKGLDANTKYKFKVVSYDKNKDGKYVKGESSKAVSVTTKK